MLLQVLVFCDRALRRALADDWHDVGDGLVVVESQVHLFEGHVEAEGLAQLADADAAEESHGILVLLALGVVDAKGEQHGCVVVVAEVEAELVGLDLELDDGALLGQVPVSDDEGHPELVLYVCLLAQAAQLLLSEIEVSEEPFPATVWVGQGMKLLA